tara:strand:+ start:305 stop:562 length:258 start_codon:yes stop_codon:yes gene_type:complete
MNEHQLMPTKCGVYLWDTEPTTVWIDINDDLIASNEYLIAEVEAFDDSMRKETERFNGYYLPWLYLGQCQDDDCQSPHHQPTQPE